MAFVNATYAVSDSGNDSVTIDVPAHTDGDVIVCLVETIDETISWGFAPTAAGQFITTGGAGRASSFDWATKTASSEPSTYTFSIGGGNGLRLKAVCLALSGRSSATPSASQTTNDAGASSTPISTPLGGVTAAEGDDIVILTGDAATTASTAPIAFAAPTNYTTRATGVVTGVNFSSGGVAVATRDNVSAGATGTLTGSWSHGTGHGDTAGVVLAFSAAGGSPATISDPTPSGTIGTTNTATVGCTTDTEEGTLYAVLSETDNVEEADPEEIEAGENENGDPADFADDAAVTDSTPEVAFSGLDPDTTYYYAMVHKTDDGYSNVLSGSFTTAAAPISSAYIRETLIDKLGDPVASVTGITMAVYHAVPTEAAPNPHEVIEDVATDSDGEIEVEIDLGDLEEGDPVWIALFKDGGTPAGTLKKVTPEYE